MRSKKIGQVAVLSVLISVSPAAGLAAGTNDGPRIQQTRQSSGAKRTRGRARFRLPAAPRGRGARVELQTLGVRLGALVNAVTSGRVKSEFSNPSKKRVRSTHIETVSGDDLDRRYSEATRAAELPYIDLDAPGYRQLLHWEKQGIDRAHAETLGRFRTNLGEVQDAVLPSQRARGVGFLREVIRYDAPTTTLVDPQAQKIEQMLQKAKGDRHYAKAFRQAMEDSSAFVLLFEKGLRNKPGWRNAGAWPPAITPGEKAVFGDLIALIETRPGEHASAEAQEIHSVAFLRFGLPESEYRGAELIRAAASRVKARLTKEKKQHAQ